MKKIIIVTILSWLPLMGSELKTYFDKQDDINPASLSTRSSIKRRHNLCFDDGDELELLWAKRPTYTELEDNSVVHALSFDTPVLLSLDESVFAGNDEGETLTLDCIDEHDFLEPDASLDEESPSWMLDEGITSQAPTVATDIPTHDSTPSDEAAPKENESLESALSDDKVWKKNSDKSYTCIPCKATFSHLSLISGHARSHKHRRALGLPKLKWNQHKYTCVTCEMGYDFPSLLRTHQNTKVHKKMEQYRTQRMNAIVVKVMEDTIALTAQEQKKKIDLLEKLNDRSTWRIVVKNGKENYRCIRCNVTFHGRAVTFEHMQSNKHRRALGLPEREWNQRKHTCVTCKIGFKRLDALKKHESSNIHKKRFRLASK